jgi:hypothetical protein
MAIKNWIKQKFFKETHPTLIEKPHPNLTETFRSEPTTNKNDPFTQGAGEKHPTDFSELEQWYFDDAYAYGAINKIANFVVGPGFFVKSKDQRAQDIIEQFLQDTNFQIHLYQWTLKALITGNAYLELAGRKDEAPTGIRNINPTTMYIKRDRKGNIEEYNQWKGFGHKPEPFKPYEIAHLKINVKGDCAYGTGIIRPFLFSLKKKHALIADMTKIMKRKANTPNHLRS